MIKEISSLSNERIKHVVRLRDGAKARRNEGLVFLEGWRLIKDCPPNILTEIYLSAQFYALLDTDREKAEWFESVKDRVSSFMLAGDAFNKISDTKTPQGIIAVASYCLTDLKLLYTMYRDTNPLLIALENVQDAGNVGAIIRSALGAGACGVIVSGDTADCMSPKVIRSGMGAVFKLPIFKADNFTQVLKQLSEADAVSFKLYAAASSGRTVYDTCDFTQPCIIVVGNEASGISDAVESISDFKIKIPLCGELESLNVGVAASVILFEAQRQRNIHSRMTGESYEDIK